ncbi:hypothetical protein AVEN_169634-1 [Araneus ventricosus]|uniref:Uncharacterized protein n=1 Tax=Araneus ventricosus TaxID=182803 RepID=A0A4Y2MHQ3_ARAVE|nr:hypothetical protein AVEN_169634-1 [Araneus ventricosus]
MSHRPCRSIRVKLNESRCNNSSTEARVLVALTGHGPTPPEGGTYYNWRRELNTPVRTRLLIRWLLVHGLVPPARENRRCCRELAQRTELDFCQAGLHKLVGSLQSDMKTFAENWLNGQNVISAKPGYTSWSVLFRERYENSCRELAQRTEHDFCQAGLHKLVGSLQSDMKTVAENWLNGLDVISAKPGYTNRKEIRLTWFVRWQTVITDRYVLLRLWRREDGELGCGHPDQGVVAQSSGGVSVDGGQLDHVPGALRQAPHQLRGDARRQRELLLQTCNNKGRISIEQRSPTTAL